jgi:glycosyltransferase involved in cell wall biosynthesis
MEIVQERLGAQWRAFAGQAHLDLSVRTDLPPNLYVAVTNLRLMHGRLLLQWGRWIDVLLATTAIVDLNPRSVNAWVFLLSRKVLRRRTLVWGHLDPRRGREARTASVRTAMRRLADGCIVYTYESEKRLRTEHPSERVWVAPNALYRREFLRVAAGEMRVLILYVGRLESAKKPDLLLEAFALVASDNPDWKLTFVGDGALRQQLRSRAAAHGLADRVHLLGTMSEPRALAALYSQARCSVSPGYVGLTLTQSLGFGVPMVIADDEPHSPEIELATRGAAVFFEHDSAASLAHALSSPKLELDGAARERLVLDVSARYSAEAMADGLISAATGAFARGNGN